MIVQQSKKRKFDQHINYYPTYDDPLNLPIQDDVTRHQENDNTTTHTRTHNTTPQKQYTHNLFNNTNLTIEQYTTNHISINNNKTYTKRGPSNKINNPYKGESTTQHNRPIENIIDKDTVEALNHNIYNIKSDYIKIGTINIQKAL
jgi:hypothetical protein